MKAFATKIIKSEFLSRLILVIVAAAIASATFQIVSNYLGPQPWSPLGPFPEQIVQVEETIILTDPTEKTEIEYPLVSLSSENVPVTGTKCANEIVQVKGISGWVSSVPPGFSGPELTGVAERTEGCVTRSFQNAIPYEIKVWATALLLKGETPVVRIAGCEVPVRPNNDEGSELCWKTEDFALKE